MTINNYVIKLHNLVAPLVVVLILGLLAYLGISIATAQELNTNELQMKTDVGAVVLTVEACPVKQAKYLFKAYATEQTGTAPIVHNGCWNKEASRVDIWFYEEPQQPFVASYEDYHFKPKPKADM